VRGGSVYVVRADGTNERRPNWELYSIRSNGSGERRLTRTPRATEENPRFQPRRQAPPVRA